MTEQCFYSFNSVHMFSLVIIKDDEEKSVGAYTCNLLPSKETGAAKKGQKRRETLFSSLAPPSHPAKPIGGREGGKIYDVYQLLQIFKLLIISSSEPSYPSSN